MATPSIETANIYNASLCSECENKRPYLKKESELYNKLLINQCTDIFIESYKDNRNKFVQTFYPRVGDYFGYNISTQCQILRRVYSLVNGYELQNCSTVFTDSYFKYIDSQNPDDEYINSFDFESCLYGDEGDDIFKYTESPGLNIYVCSPKVMHRPVMVDLLNHIASGLHSIYGEVEISYGHYTPQHSSVTGHRLFPIWIADRDIPTLSMKSIDFSMCFRFVSCPSFQNCTDWLDFADLLMLHGNTGSTRFASPNLDMVYDEMQFTLQRKTEKGEDAFKTIWEEACDKTNNRCFRNVIFLFLNNQSTTKTTETQMEILSEYTPQSHSLLIDWNIMKKQVCGNTIHTTIFQKSPKPFKNISECQAHCVKYLHDNDIIVNTDIYINYTMCLVNRYYLENGFVDMDKNLHEHVLKHPVQYTWQLNKQGVLCPDPRYMNHPDTVVGNLDFDNNVDDRVYTHSVANHVITVGSGNHWFNSLEECLENFHSEMLMRPEKRKYYYNGCLAISLQPLTVHTVGLL